MALLDVPGFDLSFGINESTALVVDGPQVRAEGASAVTVFDARDAVRSGPSARGVTMHLMSAGDVFDLPARRYTASAAKTALVADGPAATSPANIVAPWAFLQALESFGRSAERELSWPVSGGAITLRKDDGFRATRLNGFGVQNVVAGLGMTGLKINVQRSAFAARPVSRQRASGGQSVTW